MPVGFPRHVTSMRAVRLCVLLGIAVCDCAPPAPDSASCRGDVLLQTHFWHDRARPEQSHVVVRRQLAHKLLGHQGQLDDEVEEYAKYYHEMLAQSSQVVFQHVSKSAGSMICGVGRANGCRTTTTNCHINPQDAPVWLETEPPSCSSLLEMYTRENITLEGNERFLGPHGLCPEFWNVIVVRDPVMRLLSHMYMLSRGRSYSRYDPEDWVGPSLAEVFASEPRLSNNFYIRSLLGGSVYHLPFGAVGAHHLEEAVRVLEGFDALLIADERNASLLEGDIHATLGFDVKPRHYRRDYATQEYRRGLNWTDRDWEALDAANALDRELWRRARELNSMDSLVFRHPTFAATSARMPQGPCGYLAK